MQPDGIEAVTNTNEPLLIVISGPSAAGKDTVIKALLERSLPLYTTINANTRPPRPEEVDGVDYFFVTKAEFQAMLEAGEFFEHSDVYVDKKGILRSEILKGLGMGKDVILRIDVQGASKVRQICSDALLIFLTTSNLMEQAQRLTGRATETDESLKARLETAREEMAHLPEFDYLVINHQGRLDETVDKIAAIIQAEHQRVHPRKICLE
jgi:guanylate kinase